MTPSRPGPPTGGCLTEVPAGRSSVAHDPRRDGVIDDRRHAHEAPGAVRTSRRARPQADLLFLTAALAWAAGFIHSAVIVEHFDEYWLFGLFFVIVAGLQFLWGAWAYWSPLRRVLLIGALGNAALVAIWTISRISGLPFGPEPWQAESAGVVDVVATLDELAVVILVAAILRTRARVHVVGPGRPVMPGQSRLAPALVSALFSASVLALMLGAHHHT